MAGSTQLWAERRLGDVARIKTGSRNNQDKSEFGEYPFFVRSSTVERIDSYSYNCEAILIPGEGGIGSIFHYINGRFEVHQRVYKISDFSETVPGKFVFHYMSHFFSKHAASNSVKATVDSLRLPAFKSFTMFLPTDVREQKAIAHALDKADDLISTLERLIKKKQAIKQGMMQELLTGRTRLPGFTEPWQTLRFSEVLTVRHGKSQTAVERPSGRFPILATGGQIGWTDTPLHDGPSVLIGRKGTIDRPQYQDSPFWTIDTLFYTEIAPIADPKFLYYVFLTVDWRSLNEASGVPSLSASRVESLSVELPEFDEQHAIRTVLDDAACEINVLRKRLAKSRAIKRGMMQQLLTGRIRLPVAEVAT
jgi:type I restriction enzyme S subunit